jgi:hypothetical protein
MLLVPICCPSAFAMKQVSLQFKSLSELAECMSDLGVDKLTINYKAYILTCKVTGEQLEYAIKMKAHIVEKTDIK